LKLMTWSVLAIEIFALVGVLFKRTRFTTWLLLLSIHLGILVTINFADLTTGMILFHLFLFDPRWLKAKKQSDLIVFYDGECGVCNGFVQFILKNSIHIKFAPLQGESAKQKLPIELTNDLDTI